MRLDEHVEVGFGRVADAFRHVRGLDDPRGGSAFCLYVDGRKVVDLVDGVARADHADPYDRNTIQVVFSCTKGITAIAVNMLADTGAIDLDAPVARYWPEFAAQGKSGVTIDDVLSHRSGLPCCDETLSLAQVCDGTSVALALARQQPMWRPGSGHGYHAVTYGFLLGAIVERACGTTIGGVVRDGIAHLDQRDLWIGLPDGEFPRVAELIPATVPTDPELRRDLRRFAPGTDAGRALSLDGVLPISGPAFPYNRPGVLAAELPAANAVCSANALATLYSSTVRTTGGSRLLSARAVEHARQPLSDGIDRILGRRTRFGRGFMLPTADVPMLSPKSFGHPGAGGSLGLADPDLGVGLAYLTTSMGPGIVGDPRANAMVDATRSTLA